MLEVESTAEGVVYKLNGREITERDYEAIMQGQRRINEAEREKLDATRDLKALVEAIDEKYRRLEEEQA